MPEFLVLYEVPRLIISHESGSFYDNEGHALVVQANDVVQAFIIAFDHLTRHGHMVRTIKPGEIREDLLVSQEQQRAYNPDVQVIVISGLSLDQMEQVWQAGVPIIGGRGDNRKMTRIIKIEPYQLSGQEHKTAPQA